MPFDKLGSAAAKSPAPWPGLQPLGAKPVPKFGTVQQAPRSAPQRALDYLRHKLEQVGILKRTSVQTGPAPLPRHVVAVAPMSKLLGPALEQLAEKWANHDDAGFADAVGPLETKIGDILDLMRSGKITRWLGAEMKDALASGDTQAFVQALETQALEGLPPESRVRFDAWLSPLIKDAVDASIRDKGPLSASPPAPATAPKPLLGPNQEPLVRLQALAASPADMAPVLATLDKIADAMSLGDSALVEQQLSTLSGQLRPLLERQDKAVKVAFAQSSGQAFIQDLSRAILARTPEDSQEAVALELEHFMGPYLKSAFDELVGGMLDANPEVQRASFKLPFDANVGVVALRNVAQAMLALQKVSPAAPDEDKLQASLLLRREIGNFLGLVRSGAIAPELAESFLNTMQGDDTQAFVDVMSRALLNSVPPDQREQVGALLATHLSTVVQADLVKHGPLTIGSSPPPTLQPKTHFDAPLLPPARLGLLQGTAAQTQTALATLAEVSQAMSSSNPDAVKNKLGQLVGQLKPMLQAQPDAVRLAFTLSDGRGFVDDLAAAILEQTPASEREFVATQLELFMRPALQRAFDRLASGVLDSADFNPDRPDDPPRSVTVGGKTYEVVRDERGVPQSIGEGSFGVIYKYRNPADEKDAVVLKLPLRNGVARGSAEERKRLLDDPVHEGFNSLLAMGSGGGTARTSRLLGAVRTDDRVLLVYRFEPHGTLKQGVDALNQGRTDEKVARGKLGLMQDLVGALRRLHEAKGLVHLDIALRNVLLDDKGRAVLNDFGLSQPMPEGSALDGASAMPGTDLLPLRWLAPEVRQGQPVTQQAEVFSLGVTFIELAWGLGKGTKPWEGAPPDTFKKTGPAWDAQAMMALLPALPAAKWPGVDVAQLQQLITRMIDADPTQRPTLAEVAASPLFLGVLPEHREALLAKLGASGSGADSAMVYEQV